MIRKTISMPDEMGAWIAEQLSAGRYSNESEYVRDLIRRDQEELRKQAHVAKVLAVAEAQLAAGEYTVLETREDIRALFDDIDAEVGREARPDREGSR